MKKGTAILFALGAMLAPAMQSAHAQGAFEGTVVWSMVSPAMGDDEKHEMVMNMKGEKLEMDMDGGMTAGKIKIFVDNTAKKTYLYMPSMKMGFETPIEDNANAKSDDKSELTPTGQKATIAGKAAEAYTMKDDKSETTVWLSNDFPAEIRNSYMAALKSVSQNGKHNAQNAFKKYAEKGYLPVKFESKEDGELQGALELVKIEAKKVDDATFTLPTDVTFRAMPKGAMGH